MAFEKLDIIQHSIFLCRNLYHHVLSLTRFIGVLNIGPIPCRKISYK